MVILLDIDTLKAIKSISDKVNDVQAKLDAFIQSQVSAANSDIEYLAMMTDVDLDSEDSAIEEEPEE